MTQLINISPDRSRTVNSKVAPVAPKALYKDVRDREHLYPKEVEQVLQAAKSIGRYGHRDYTLVLMAYRHGLRVAELVALKWSQIDLKEKTLHVMRVKNGSPSTHYLTGKELRALRELQRQSPDCRYVFQTERLGPLSPSSVRNIVKRAGRVAKLPFPIHSHMLRHSAGYYLANEGTDTRLLQGFLGHKQIQHTVKYTELAPNRYKGLWKD